MNKEYLTEQHRHPLASSSHSSVTWPCAFIERLLSMPALDPNSLRITAMRVVSVGSASRLVMSVVLPLPRNPVMIVTGTAGRSTSVGVSSGINVGISESESISVSIVRIRLCN